MRFSTIVLIAALVAAPCFATVDPDPDQIGIYFDRTADTNSQYVNVVQIIHAFIVITNPTSPEIWGLEYSLCTEVIGGSEDMLVALSEEWPTGMTIQPESDAWCSDGRAEVFPAPVLPVGTNAVIVELLYQTLADISVNFYLGPNPTQSIEDGLPAYIGMGGEIMPLGLSSGDSSLPVATLNGLSPVGVQNTTLSTLKCLYR